MILKYYAEVPHIGQAIAYYQSLFPITIIKDGANNHHGKIKLFNQVTLLLHQEKSHRAKPGYYILRFSETEKDLFIASTEHLRAQKDLKIHFDNYPGKWGTTFFEFSDKYGYTWDLEIDSQLLKAS